MTDRRVLRWDVPVDDSWHQIGGGPVMLVDCRALIPGAPTGRVEVWTLERVGADWPKSGPLDQTREVAVFGTGHRLDPQARTHLGSVLDPAVGGSLVWHIFERGPAWE